MTTEQRLDSIDARLDRLVTLNEQALTRQDRTDEKIDRLVALQEQSIIQQSRLDEKLEVLSDQVGRMTEGLTHLQIIVQEQSEISKRQAQTAQQQAESIAQLTTLARELLNQRR
jgi:hypothetical protein